jgi:hypothetical protein
MRQPQTFKRGPRYSLGRLVMVGFWFQIDLAMPASLTAELQGDITAAIRPRWRVTGIEMRRLGEGLFRLKLTVDSDDKPPDVPPVEEFTEFRDLIVSLVAFSAMVPVQLRSKGLFDYPAGGSQRKQLSLGPMNYEFPPTPLSDLKPLVLGLALQQKYESALHFLWLALNSEHPLYRFINLAVAVELLVRHDSSVRGSRHPTCGDPKCGYELGKCPKCNREWKIAHQLRDRAAFLLPADILSAFIGARNQVFHGLSDELHHDYSRTLPELNVSLLVVLRNYLGQQMGLPAISPNQLSIALNPPEAYMVVSYDPPPESG